MEKLVSAFNMRNIRQPKKSHNNISNLEDHESSRSTTSTIVGSTATTGLLKPPVNFTAKTKGHASKKRAVEEEDDDCGFSDLEDLLEKDLSS